jgi:fibronectin type 3 domain-containing protein
VAAEGAISLIWDPNTEKDLDGYLVLRGEATGEKLQPLTPGPIHETTYRDASVRPGVRYFYAVVAVDRATPPNQSAISARVEEVAR